MNHCAACGKPDTDNRMASLSCGHRACGACFGKGDPIETHKRSCLEARRLDAGLTATLGERLKGRPA